jgi:hypothetical protein
MKLLFLKTILLFLSVFLVTSCSNNDEKSTEQDNHKIVSTWNLVRFEQFGPIYNYPNEEIQWTFNSDGTLNVEIVEGTEISNNLPLNSSGTYSYSIENNGIFLDAVLYPFEIQNNELIIIVSGTPSIDGKQITFIKDE